MFKLRYPLQAPDHQGNGGAVGMADFTKALDTAMAKMGDQFKQQMGVNAQAMQILADGMTKLEQQVTELKAAGPAKGGSRGKSSDSGDGDDDDDPASGNGVDLETMSNRELVNHITGRLVRVVEEGIGKSLNEKFAKLEEGLGQVAGHIVTGEVAAKHKDMKHWAKEIDDERKRNPALGIEDALVLARSRNPEKATKIAEEAKKAEDADKAKNTPRFGGLTPTSSVGGASDDRKMGVKEAAEAAWSDIQSTYGNILEGNSTNV